MTEKNTTSPPPWNQDWKNSESKTENVNKLSKITRTGHISRINELIYAGAKLVCEKIGIRKGTRKKNKTLVGN